MNFRRSVFGLAMPLLLAGACTSDDSTPNPGPNDAASTDSAGSGGTGGSGGSAGTAGGSGGAVPEAAAPDAPQPVTDGGAPDASVTPDGPLGDAAPAPVCGPLADGGSAVYDASASPSPTTSFFVSSQTNMTGNLGGLAGADARCQTLATMAGLGSKTWHAYLSVEHDAARGNAASNARDRIGTGPWFNARGVQVAADLASLHSRTGDPAVFLDEHGNMINGQWTGSPSPTEHDVLTGSNPDGTVAIGKTCVDWTSAQPAPEGGVAADGGSLFVARVGHTDGFGPACSTATTPNNVTSWNSAHDNAGCDNNAPRGGAGRIYCFAVGAREAGVEAGTD
jgi:hypothetical protein